MSEGQLVGIGNPLLDISANVDDEFLEKYDLKPDNAILAEKKHMSLYGELIEKWKAEFIAGGSVQNSLRVAQWILQKPKVAVFFGCVGDDDYAKIIEKEARRHGVNTIYQITNEVGTGTCAVLITGTHRSLCANLGAANNFTIDHINKPEVDSYLQKAEFFYISGFFLTVSPSSILKVAQLALQLNKPFMMNLSAEFISQFYRTPLMEAMPYVDILFGNEQEAIAFARESNFGTEDLKEIAHKICNLPKQNEKKSRTCVITQGSQPVLLAQDGNITEFAVKKLDQNQIIDTNGAGDAFVGGFLAQLVMGKHLDTCIRCGIWAAGKIIQSSGCTFSGTPDFTDSLE